MPNTAAIQHDFSTAISTAYHAAYTSHDRPRRTIARSRAEPYAQEARWARGALSWKAIHAAAVVSASVAEGEEAPVHLVPARHKAGMR